MVRGSRLSELFIHNILIHVPHHVDARIPVYRLTRAYADLKGEYGAYLHEYRFRWSTVWMIFRRALRFRKEDLVHLRSGLAAPGLSPGRGFALRAWNAAIGPVTPCATPQWPRHHCTTIRPIMGAWWISHS